jgi:hypothetical protein
MCDRGSGRRGEGQRPDSLSSLSETTFDFWGDSESSVANLHITVEDLLDGWMQITIFDFERGCTVFEEARRETEMLEAILLSRYDM